MGIESAFDRSPSTDPVGLTGCGVHGRGYHHPPPQVASPPSRPRPMAVNHRKWVEEQEAHYKSILDKIQYLGQPPPSPTPPHPRTPESAILGRIILVLPPTRIRFFSFCFTIQGSPVNQRSARFRHDGNACVVITHRTYLLMTLIQPPSCC